MTPVPTPTDTFSRPERSKSEIARQLSTTELLASVEAATDRTDPFSEACALELFRRAICDDDNAACQATMARYRKLVLSWVRQHGANLTGDDGVDWVNSTFERFWMAVRPERWSQFTRLASVFRYLKLCAHSVVLDDLRRRRSVHDVPLEAVSEFVADTRDDGPLGEVLADDLWRLVLQLLHDPRERLVAELSLVHGFTPREIQARQPQRFATVADVYRIKRNLLDRLRRSPELRSLKRGEPS